MIKKYELTNESITLEDGVVLHRIKALKSFGDITKGDLGGWIEKEDNLSHNGKAWVYGNAKVYGNARVYDDGRVAGNAKVYGNAWVCDNAWVHDMAWVYDNAIVYDDACVGGKACVYNDARVYGNAWVYGYALVCDKARVYDKAKVHGNAKVTGNAWVHGNARVHGNAKVSSNADIGGDACILDGHIIAKVSLPYKDIFQCQCKKRTLTAILTLDNRILYTIGCQENITEEIFLDRIYNENGGLNNNPHRKEYLRLIDCIKLYFNYNDN